MIIVYDENSDIDYIEELEKITSKNWLLLYG